MWVPVLTHVPVLVPLVKPLTEVSGTGIVWELCQGVQVDFRILDRWVGWSLDSSRMDRLGLRGSSPELFHQHSSTSAQGSFPPGRKRRAQANLPAQAVSA